MKDQEIADLRDQVRLLRWAVENLLAPHLDEDGLIDPETASEITGTNARGVLVLKGSFIANLTRAQNALRVGEPQ